MADKETETAFREGGRGYKKRKSTNAWQTKKQRKPSGRGGEGIRSGRVPMHGRQRNRESHERERE